MKKKIVAVFLCMAMTAGLLAGCGGGGTGGSGNSSSDSGAADSSSDSAATDSDSGSQAAADTGSEAEADGNYEPITIEFWNSWTGGDGNTLVAMVEKFNQENKWGITVEMDISAQFSEKLATAAPAHEAADLILLGTSSQWNWQEYLQDVDDIFDNTDLNKSDFTEGGLSVGMMDDKLYGMPFQYSVYLLYWNKDLFEKAGLDPNTPPKNHDEWAEMAAKITDEANRVYGTGCYPESPVQVASTMTEFGDNMVVEAGDGKFKANFANNPGYDKFFKWEADLIANGDFPREADLASMFKAGQLGLLVDGPWLQGGCDETGVNYGVTLQPYGDAGNFVIADPAEFYITTSASPEEKLAAERFIQWWYMGNDSSTNLEDCGDYTWSNSYGYPSSYLPTINSDAYKNNERLQSVTPPADATVKSTYAPSTFKAANDVQAILNTLQQAVVYGDNFESDYAAAIATAQEEMEKVIVNVHGDDALAQ